MLYLRSTEAQLRLLARAVLSTLTVTVVFVGPHTAAVTPTFDTKPLVESCTRPDLAGAPSADLIQRSIDSCRRAVAETAAYRTACLGDLGDASRSPDVLQGWLDGCRLDDGVGL